MLPERYSLSNLLGALNEPRRFIDELHRAKKTVYDSALKVNGIWYQRYRVEPDFDIFDSRFENVFILDGCRPELLSEVSPPEWEIETRPSPATYSNEFMEEVLRPRPRHDTVYITANPHSSKLPDDLFHATYNLLETHWDEDQQTVLPEDIAEFTESIAADHPNKRLLVHFMQPHFPFLGETGQELDHAGIEMHKSQGISAPHPWFRQMYYSDIGHDELIQAFRENHSIVVDQVDKLRSELPGRTLVTADHANLMGERGFPIPMRMYGHPPGVHKSELIEVPWIEFGGQPRDLDAEPPEQGESIDDEIARDRLRQLGYAE